MPGEKHEEQGATETLEGISVQLEHVCLQYPYKQLEAATKGFHESCRLGEGSAGTVFRAELPDGSYAAVKVIDLNALGDNLLVAGFEDEIMILSKFRHPNLVVLMGWAKEGARRFLLYECLPGGDVTGRLQKSRDGREPFLWHERLSVARDAATGLAHLHNATPRAFHRDIKSSNILLGPSGAKMADFGLSVAAKTRTSSAVDCQFPSGTPGYACPIYMRTGKVTEGSEVHSFGMVLFELLLNLVPAGMVGDEVKFPIQDTVMPLAPGATERAEAHADPTAGWPPPVAREVASLALKCIDGDESQRPCFNDVCRQLRHLQEQFPPMCVLGPQAVMPPLGMPPVRTGVLGPSPPSFQHSHPVPEQLMLMLAGPAPPAAGPGPLAAAGPPFAGPLAPAWATLAPPALVPGSAIVPPGAALPPGHPPPGYQPGAAPTFEVQPQAAGWPMTAMAPAVGICQQPLTMGPPPAFIPAPLPEVALEITYVHLAVLATMRPEFRMLPLAPSVDAAGRRSAKLGRAHQPQWFEAVLLDAGDLSCISREACEFCWGGHDPAQARLTLRVLGTGVVIVDDEVVGRGGTVPLRPGSRITLAMQACPGGDLCIIMSLAVHCSAVLGPPGGCPSRPCGAAVPVAAAQAGLPDGRPVPVHVETVCVKDKCLAATPPVPGQLRLGLLPQAVQEGTWHLECVYVAGLAPENFLALPASTRNLSLDLAPGSQAKFIGRQHQPEMFEALLRRDPKLLSCVSRNHFRLEANEGRVKVTNMSQNRAVVAQRPLHQGESLEVLDGDTLSFAHTVSSASSTTYGPEASLATQDVRACNSSVSVVPFLTLRLVGPPPPTPASPFELLGSLPAAAPPTSPRRQAPGSPATACLAPQAARLPSADSPQGSGANATELSEARPAVPATAPTASAAGHPRGGRDIVVEGHGVQAATAPVVKQTGSSLLCNAHSSQANSSECVLM